MSEKTKNHQTYFQPFGPSKIKYRRRSFTYSKALTKYTLCKIYTFPSGDWSLNGLNPLKQPERNQFSGKL